MKRKLLFAMLCIVGVLGLWAQQEPVTETAYYLYNVESGKFLTRGSNWGTKCVTNEVGSPWQVTITDGAYTLRMLDIVTGGGNKGIGSDGFSDNGSPITFTLSGDVNGYTLTNNTNVLVSPAVYGESILAESGNSTWQFLNVEEYKAKLAEKTNIQEGTVASAASISLGGSTLDAVVNDANNWRKVDVSASVPFPSNDVWTQVGVPSRGGNANQGSYGVERYQGGGSYSYTVTGLAKGIYKVGIKAMYRSTWNATCYAIGEAGYVNSSAYLSANGNIVQVKDWYSSCVSDGNPNSTGQFVTIANDGGYLSEVYTYVGDDGNLELSAVSESFWDVSWFLFNGIILTYYSNQVTDADITEIVSTIPTDIPSGVATSLDGLKNTLQSTKTILAYNALSAAIEEANKLVNSYRAYLSAVDDAKIVGVESSVISAQDALVADATTNEAIETCTAAIQTAVKESSTGLTTYNITPFTIKNPTAQNKTDWEGTNFGTQGNNVCEYWNKSGADFHQTITDLPAGKYRLTVVALQRTGRTGTVYAGTKRTVIAQIGDDVVNSRAQAETWFAEGNGVNEVYFSLASDGDVTIGLTADATIADHWTVWQSFKLETLDDAVAANYYATSYPGLVADAQATLDDATYANVTGVERSNLETAIAASPSTAAEYESAIEKLSTTVGAFVAAAPSYEAYASYKAETVALFGTDFSVAAPTTAAEAVAAVAALNTAQYDEVATNYTYSLNGVIGDFGSWTGTATVAGEAATPNYLNWEHWSGQQHAYYEQASNGWSNANGWTIQYEKVCKLPAGNYVLKVAARSSAGTTSKVTCSATETTIALPCAGNNTRGINTSGEASWNDDDEFANTGSYTSNPPTVGGTGAGWQWRFLPFTLTEKTEVTMTFYAEASTQYQWMSIADGELLSATDVTVKLTYDEEKSNGVKDEDVADVTIFRNIYQGYNTVVLPFNLGANQVTELFGDGSKVYNYSENSEDAEKVTINFKEGDGSISANVPVLVKATEDKGELVFKGVQIIAPTEDEIMVEGKNIDFVGSYSPIKKIEAGNYFLNYGKLYKSEGKTSMNAFRAYLRTKSADVRAELFIDGVATAIEAIDADNSVQNGAIYNLAGQRVQKAQRGLYIVNGKKVVIK